MKKLNPEEELLRQEALWEYEKGLKAQGYKFIAGVDEAGRGPLAGPVYAAAVILKEDAVIDGINDSKKLTEKKREELFDIIKENALPITMTSYSPCFRKEVGAHGIEERGIYRVHQFEKQEMVVICKKEESMDWYNKMWSYTVEFFRSLDVPVRTLECCSGDLADLKVKSCDIEAWSPRQKKYFEVGSCSNLTDAQARRLQIRYKDTDGKVKLAHTLNNTVVAPPRMLIAFVENHLQADGSVTIPEALQPYMGGKKVILPKN